MGSRRHYGLDWLRIAAFALLILYHVGMVFAPWDWIVKAPATIPALIVPMALLNPWRLALLFAVSGYASRCLFDKSQAPGGFLRARTKRLLIPVAFGVAVLLPPEMWVRAQAAGYHGDFLRFWTHDYWLPESAWGGFPHWEHLWFVVYLWGYTLALTALLGLAGTARIDAVMTRWLTRDRILWLPIMLLVAAKWAMMFVVPEREGLFVDWTAHAEYFPMLLFGFALAGSARSLWPAVLDSWRPAAAVALASGAIVLAFELTYQGQTHPGHAMMMVDRAARLTMAWAMVLLGLNVAERWWNRDHAWRATLVEAVFPLYLVHQGAIVVIAWITLGYGLSAPVEFVLLVAGTLVVASGCYVVGRRIGWLRPLIGLAPVRSARKRALTPALSENL